jgi:hypothetical protein
MSPHVSPHAPENQCRAAPVGAAPRPLQPHTMTGMNVSHNAGVASSSLAPAIAGGCGRQEIAAAPTSAPTLRRLRARERQLNRWTYGSRTSKKVPHFPASADYDAWRAAFDALERAGRRGA